MYTPRTTKNDQKAALQWKLKYNIKIINLRSKERKRTSSLFVPRSTDAIELFFARGGGRS